jgi:transposase
MVTSKRIGAKVFIEFLKRLIHGAKETIFLIVDRHPAHRAKSVEAYLKTVSNRLRLYILAPYAPELNPDEYVWNDLKNNAVGRMAIKTSADLKKTAISRLRFLQKSPERVRSFFCAPSSQHALYNLFLYGHIKNTNKLTWESR